MKEPSRELIIKWMNAELSGNDLDSVESWADENPDLAGKIISELEEPITSFATIPSVVEPPYADFLNSKIKQGIEAEESFTEAVPVKEVKPSLWSRLQLLFVPVALAAMVASFMLGMQYGNQPGQQGVVAKVEPQQASATLVYIPEEAVTFETKDTGEESFIVLEGLEPISDDDIAMISNQAPLHSVRFVSKTQRDEGWY